MAKDLLKEIKIEKLVFGGQGLGHGGGRTVFAWNALPGETVDVRPAKIKKDYAEGVAENIIVASPDRIAPLEPDHYLSCSPWQIMSQTAENEWKKKIAVETYQSIGKLSLSQEPEITASGEEYGYRNKMEYSLILDEAGDIGLAFFNRGRRSLQPIRECRLAQPVLNATAAKIVRWLNSFPVDDYLLKSLIVRSNSFNETIAALFITEYYNFPNLPKLDKDWIGFHVYYSRPETPASTPEKMIYSEGASVLAEDVMGMRLKYGLFSFFQVNPPIFSQTLTDIGLWLNPKRTTIDFYSGVGAISLPLREKSKKFYLVDNSRDAINLAEENIVNNNIENAKAIYAPAEKMLSLVKKDRLVLLDPPRAGLHPDVAERLLAKKPERIIYLSCNLSTQARDICLLSEAYEVKFIKLYNFFPRTPHIEGLVVLERK